MNQHFKKYGTKIFSIALIFNSLMSISCVIELLFNFYKSIPYWQPFAPYLIDGNIFWLIIIAAIINIYPSASIGRKIKTGRLFFHHYVYGFIVLIIAFFSTLLFAPISFFNIFITQTSDIAINAGRFFILGGLALFIDDVPDVSKKVAYTLNYVKTQVYKIRKLIHYLHLVLGIGCLYVSFAILFWVINNPKLFDLGNIILVGTILISALTSLILMQKQAWLKMKVD
ncbi:MAG: hypothetical protein GX638_09790 [Crenarchaeota archaeon]|nr:hypothetical protein [Thermoproteota archaeon]